MDRLLDRTSGERPRASRLGPCRKVRPIAKTKPTRAPVKKVARRIKQPVAPAIETVAVEVIEQPAPGSEAQV